MDCRTFLAGRRKTGNKALGFLLAEEKSPCWPGAVDFQSNKQGALLKHVAA
jgi:hypothetical protein